MRIAMVTNLYPPAVMGGYELLARDVAELLAARGHTVDVLTTKGTVSDRDTGSVCVDRRLVLARTFEEAPPRGRDRLRQHVAALANAKALEAWLARGLRPDVVLAMSQRRLGLEPLRALARVGVPIVATVNDDWPVAYARCRGRSRVVDLLDWTATRRATWWNVPIADVVYLSGTIRELVRSMGAPLPLGVVQPQGVDRALFAPRAFRPLPSERPVELLFAGRLHPSKAPDVAIDALAAVRRAGREARLTLAGAADDPAFERALRARAASAGVAAHVRWLGLVERARLPEIYRAADVFLFPNRFEGEGQGLTYLEAMSCGVPVVASPTGGARELLSGSGAALLAAADGESFARAIGALEDGATLATLRERAFALLDASASLDRYVDVIETTLARSARCRDVG